MAVDGQDCKWAKHSEVVHLLKSCSDRGVELSVVTLHSHDIQVSVCFSAFAVNMYLTCLLVTKT